MLLGVGLILIAEETGRILVLKELKSKPIIQKQAGMLSFPLETVKKGEGKYDAVKRLLLEEVGVDISIISLGPIFFGGTMEIFTQIAYTIQAYALCKQEFVVTPNDTDIEFYGWMNPKDLLKCQFIRAEVPPIINLFLSKKRFGYN
jgi:8-oxo-dGTP pyrophosphatase MutT (NUDIX family)